MISGSILIKENAPVGTRIAKLVVTDQRSSKVEKDLIFSLVNDLLLCNIPILSDVQKLHGVVITLSWKCSDLKAL